MVTSLVLGLHSIYRLNNNLSAKSDKTDLAWKTLPDIGQNGYHTFQPPSDFKECVIAIGTIGTFIEYCVRSFDIPSSGYPNEYRHFGWHYDANKRQYATIGFNSSRKITVFEYILTNTQGNTYTYDVYAFYR